MSYSSDTKKPSVFMIDCLHHSWLHSMSHSMFTTIVHIIQWHVHLIACDVMPSLALIFRIHNMAHYMTAWYTDNLIPHVCATFSWLWIEMLDIVQFEVNVNVINLDIRFSLFISTRNDDTRISFKEMFHLTFRTTNRLEIQNLSIQEKKYPFSSNKNHIIWKV